MPLEGTMVFGLAALHMEYNSLRVSPKRTVKEMSQTKHAYTIVVVKLDIFLSQWSQLIDVRWYLVNSI